MVPAHRPRALSKAFHLEADAVVFDLEDSVPVEKKAEALACLKQFLSLTVTNVPCFVRLNPEYWSREYDTLCRFKAVTGFMMPKIHSELGIPSIRCRWLVVIETAQAILNLEAILADDRVIGGVFGVGDYAADMGVIDRDWAGPVNKRFIYAKQKLATVARAYGKQALDTSFFVKGEVSNIETERQWTEVASWGFTGASPIHPNHVPIANRVFSSSAHERAWAERILDGTSAHKHEVWVEPSGHVVGPPHVRQANGNDRRSNAGNHD